MVILAWCFCGGKHTVRRGSLAHTVADGIGREEAGKIGLKLRIHENKAMQHSSGQLKLFYVVSKSIVEHIFHHMHGKHLLKCCMFWYALLYGNSYCVCWLQSVKTVYCTVVLYMYEYDVCGAVYMQVPPSVGESGKAVLNFCSLFCCNAVLVQQ